MPFRLDFDATNKIIWLTAPEEVSDQFLIDGIATLKKFVALYGRCNCIVDYSGTTEITITSPEVRMLADTPPVFPEDYLTIHVAPHPVMYGMARMFQILASGMRPNFRVVHNVDEALELIGATSPSFVPMNLDFKERAA